DFWCGADAHKLRRRLPAFFDGHYFSDDPSPLAGFDEIHALKRPGEFEAKILAVMDKHEGLLEKHQRLSVFGVPLIWTAMVRASGGRVSKAVVERASKHFRLWDLIILPGDGYVSKGAWYCDIKKIMPGALDAWGMIGTSMDHPRQLMVSVDDLTQEMKEAGKWQ
ncbi:MAG TPA: hypothetical protein HPQ00_14430, partial [Magnetococcales bacterium]|nr:hypothetical protein [Magnetococcales bacterium]